MEERTILSVIPPEIKHHENLIRYVHMYEDTLQGDAASDPLTNLDKSHTFESHTIVEHIISVLESACLQNS